MIEKDAVLKRYNELINIKSDINELLPYLLRYAKQSNHITEMGVRTPTSTYAFLAGNPAKLISYDIKKDPAIDQVKALAPDVFFFVLQDVLEVNIEETDFLFIDTFHTATQLEAELMRHSKNVRKYIGLHDTSTFWETGESLYPGMDESKACGKGLKHAVLPFLKNGDWKIAFLTEINNGLLILEKTSDRSMFSSQSLRHFKNLFYLKSVKIRNISKKILNR